MKLHNFCELFIILGIDLSINTLGIILSEWHGCEIILDLIVNIWTRRRCKFKIANCFIQAKQIVVIKVNPKRIPMGKAFHNLLRAKVSSTYKVSF